MDRTFLVTGAMGCLGAWTLRSLVRAGEKVVAFDLSTDPYRVALVMDDADLGAVFIEQGDITDFSSVEKVVSKHNISHIIHLAALQIPFCRANPVLGAQVNVTGTVNVFEAAARHREQVQQVVYTSSVAVYGPADLYPEGPVTEEASLAPATHYGVYKQANEGTARVYARDNDVNSVGIRPYVIYGLGRDRGVTASPTKAMLAAAMGRDYAVTYGGTCNFQWASDAAETLVSCALQPVSGTVLFNLGGSRVSVAEVVQAIEEAAPEMRGRITYPDGQLPFPPNLSSERLQTFLPKVPETPLAEGVRSTVEGFKRLIAEGRIDVENAMRDS